MDIPEKNKMRNGVELKVMFSDGSIITYPSISEAAKVLGINRQEIHRYLRGEYKVNKKGWIFYT